MYSPAQDSAFAKALLTESTKSENIKKALEEVSPKLSQSVLMPLIEKLTNNSPLNEEEKGVIDFLATEHSEEGLQWGGALPQISKKGILDNKENTLLLLTMLSKRLEPKYIANITNSEDLAGVMKALTDCSFCYVEKLKSRHSKEFDSIKTNIFPTPEELAIRVMRKEVNEPEQVAITYGIGTQSGLDLAPKNDIPPNSERVHNTGKSTFSGANALKRVELIVKEFDTVSAKLHDINTQIKTLALSETQQSKDLSIKLTTERDECLQKLQVLSGKMKFYQIPEDPKLRKSELSSHPIPKPSIEKLSHMGIEGYENSLPMIATASGTTARTLIALQDLGAFSPNGSFTPRLAQSVSSTLCGTIVHGGHHSVLEVGEMYNRLLDYNAISQMEQREKVGQKEEANEDPSSYKEFGMPYYHIGDSLTLVPIEMRQGVFEEQQRILSVGNSKDMKGKLSTMKGGEGKEVSDSQSKNPNQFS